MALFAVNTGCREQEICSLRWEWEVMVPQLGTSVFIIPGERVKNGDKRLVVLNHKSVVDARRGESTTHVFTYKGRPITRMMTSAWKRARMRAELPQVRVHDLKHTFGRRLPLPGPASKTARICSGIVPLASPRFGCRALTTNGSDRECP